MILSLMTKAVLAHGGQPMAQAIIFQESHPGVQWVLTDNQGVYANLKSGFRWLCEDAIAPTAGLRGLQLHGEKGELWTVATSQGLFRSTDSGCGFERIQGPTRDRPLAGLWSLDGTWWTGSAVVDSPNDLYRSNDQGRTWHALELALDGRVIELFSPRTGGPLYLHTSTGLFRHRVHEEGFTRLELISGGRSIPGHLIMEVRGSTQDDGYLLATIDAGIRTRMLRSIDAGQTWSDVALFSQPNVQFIISRDGARVLAVSHLGLSWRSEDNGLSWTESTQIARGMNCLRHDPDHTRIWACGDVYNGAAWVTAYSEDFGLSFTPSFMRYEDSSERWDCEARDNATRCCRGLCTGNLMSIECGQPEPGQLAQQCIPDPPEAIEPVMTDQGVAPISDVGFEKDSNSDDGADVFRDGRITRTQSSASGCQAGPAPLQRWVWVICVISILTISRRRVP